MTEASDPPPAPGLRLVVLAGVFVTALVVANIAALKPIEVFGATVDAGNLVFPLSYLLGDVLTEVYGIRTARRVIVLGFACNLLAIGTFALAAAIPIAPGQTSGFDATIGPTGRVFVASLVAYLAGELTNASVLWRLKRATRDRFLWLRAIASTLVGEAIDTTLFVTLFFATQLTFLLGRPVATLDAAGIVASIRTQWLVKCGWEVVALPLTYAVVAYLKRAEGIAGPPPRHPGRRATSRSATADAT